MGKKVGVSQEEKNLSYYKYFEQDLAPISEEKLAILAAGPADPKTLIPFSERQLFLEGKDETEGVLSDRIRCTGGRHDAYVQYDLYAVRDRSDVGLAISEGVSIPMIMPQGLYAHNIKEFTNLAAILPTLYAEEKDVF